jgi:CrcB protein
VVKVLIVGVGGFLGAAARYGLSGLVHRYLGSSFPFGTLTVNVAGCLLIGMLVYAAEDRAAISPNARLFLAIGLMGAFTTFSTFGYETLAMLQDRRFAAAMLNVGANVALGVPAVWLGRTVLRAVGA